MNENPLLDESLQALDQALKDTGIISQLPVSVFKPEGAGIRWVYKTRVVKSKIAW